MNLISLKTSVKIVVLCLIIMSYTASPGNMAYVALIGGVIGLWLMLRKVENNTIKWNSIALFSFYIIASINCIISSRNVIIEILSLVIPVILSGFGVKKSEQKKMAVVYFLVTLLLQFFRYFDYFEFTKTVFIIFYMFATLLFFGVSYRETSNDSIKNYLKASMTGNIVLIILFILNFIQFLYYGGGTIDLLDEMDEPLGEFMDKTYNFRFIISLISAIAMIPYFIKMNSLSKFALKNIFVLLAIGFGFLAIDFVCIIGKTDYCPFASGFESCFDIKVVYVFLLVGLNSSIIGSNNFLKKI